MRKWNLTNSNLLVKLADYFGISTDQLLMEEKSDGTPASVFASFFVSDSKIEILVKLHRQPEMTVPVRRLLVLSDTATVTPSPKSAEK